MANPCRNPVAELAHALAACLCAQITEDGHGETCFCGVVPGAGPAHNYGKDCAEGKNGFAWVRTGDIYPTSGVGEQNITPGNCGSSIGLSIEVGMMREMNPPEADGFPPPPAELLAFSDLITADALTMRKAIICCSHLDEKDYILGNWAPYGPQGLIVGGTWQLTVAL